MLTDGLNCWLILAQADGAGANAQQPPFWVSVIPWLPIILLFFLLIVMPQRREQKQREQMLSGMKKNDRVLTAGGIIGTVANISADGKEITLKVDDNTRIKFLRSAITQVLGEESKDDAASKPA
jgi:preprotein translocase subunit YajC